MDSVTNGVDAPEIVATDDQGNLHVIQLEVAEDGTVVAEDTIVTADGEVHTAELILDEEGDVHVVEVDGEDVVEDVPAEQPPEEAPVQDHIVLDTEDDHHEDDPTAYHVTVDDLCPTTSMYEDWTPGD